MGSRLIAITGALKGTVFALTEKESSVGREASNSITLSDPSVSRRHCLIKERAGKFEITDLNSFNGTFVNGVPIEQHPLEHGDQIAVGDILLLFLLDEEIDLPDPYVVQLDEADLVTRSTIRLQREDALYLSPERVLAALPATARIGRDLNALLKISTIVNSIRNLKQLQQQLLAAIFEVLPARRGVILLVGKNPDEVISLFGCDKATQTEQPISVSRTVTSLVMREGAAILSNDICESAALAQAESLVAFNVKSVLCVPLIFFDTVIGVIYLDSNDALSRFDERHLQLMTAISVIAAVALENAMHVEWLEKENRQLQSEIHIKHNMIGDSSAMREVYQFIARIAPTQSKVLIRGESGTGKELAAQAIHLNSSRADKPFIAINCAALADALIESELFGHEKGAFTSASAQKKGLLEIASGGTLFLDEIGELALALQAKLLRVLEEGEFKRVGGTQTHKVNVRLLAATNKNLEEATRQGTFRKDLYYRLNVVSIEMPPLRERGRDISLLANYFVMKYSGEHQRKVVGISPEARNYLMNYLWPGNVRELKNVIERAVILSTTDLLTAELLPAILQEKAPPANQRVAKLYDAVKETKKQLVLDALEQTGGNYTEAAKLLGVHPNNLHRLIRNMNLKAALRY